MWNFSGAISAIELLIQLRVANGSTILYIILLGGSLCALNTSQITTTASSAIFIKGFRQREITTIHVGMNTLVIQLGILNYFSTQTSIQKPEVYGPDSQPDENIQTERKAVERSDKRVMFEQSGRNVLAESRRLHCFQDVQNSSFN